MIKIEKGDNLFELIFELDRRLQSSQNRQSPLQSLLETFKYLEIVLKQVQEDDVIDTLFLKLIDFFIKCNCNYKRLSTCKFLEEQSKSDSGSGTGSGSMSLSSSSSSSRSSSSSLASRSSSSWMKKVSQNNSIETLKRICSLWDFSFSSDFETCNQILNLLNSCSSIFYSQPAIYGIFFESFSDQFLDSSILISVTLNCFEKLFEALKLETSASAKGFDSIQADAFIKNSNFSALIIQNSNISKYFNNEKFRKDSYKIVLITSIISGKRLIEFPNDIKIQFPELFAMLY